MTATVGQLPATASAVAADKIEIEKAATSTSHHITVDNLADAILASADYATLAAAIQALIDHGTLAGLSDDDHTQYYNQARGDARYATLAAANTFAANQEIAAAGPTFTMTPTSGKATVTLNSADAGSSWGGVVGVGRNSNAATPAAGFLRLEDKGGQFYNFWPDDSGILRIHTALPTNANDTAGTVVGAQTSHAEAKLLKGDLLPIGDVWDAIEAGAKAVKRFSYKSGAFNNEVFEGVVIDNAPRYGFDADEEHPNGRSLNVITILGDLLRAIDKLHKRVKELEKAAPPA